MHNCAHPAQCARKGIAANFADAARALHPHVMILVSSGYADNAPVHRGRLNPDVELLSKPYRGKHLAKKMRNVLDHAKHSS